MTRQVVIESSRTRYIQCEGDVSMVFEHETGTGLKTDVVSGEPARMIANLLFEILDELQTMRRLVQEKK